MPRVALLLPALLVCVSGCDRGRVDTLERRVEALEKKDTERTPTPAADGDTTKPDADLQQQIVQLRAQQDASGEKLAALAAQLSELQDQYNSLQDKMARGGAETEETAASAGPVGIKACDEYITKYRRCIEDKVPAAARSSMNDAMDATVKAWREAASGPAREGLATACEAALDAAKAATAAMGCKW